MLKKATDITRLIRWLPNSPLKFRFTAICQHETDSFCGNPVITRILRKCPISGKADIPGTSAHVVFVLKPDIQIQVVIDEYRTRIAIPVTHLGRLR